jgi:hypothetical protein
MAIVALERQELHQKIARLRALRQAAEAEKTPTDARVPVLQKSSQLTMQSGTAKPPDLIARDILASFLVCD